VLRYAARRSPQEQLAHDFALLDTNGKGYIDASDLKMIAKTLPSETRVTDADIACMCVRRRPVRCAGASRARALFCATGAHTWSSPRLPLRSPAGCPWHPVPSMLGLTARVLRRIQMITSVHGPTKGTLAQARIGLEEFATAVGAAR